MTSRPDTFTMVMIGAMYENGGNTTHRFFDGHDQMFVYPFESQIGTRLVSDMLSATFPTKYRWPTFALDASPAEDYAAIIDEETKVRTRTPSVSKFRDFPFDLSDEERRQIYVRLVKAKGRTRPNNVAAFFEATFEAWKDHRSSGEEKVYVGYSPIITIDAERILDEMIGSHFVHIVRNPWSAYADTKKRPVPLSLDNYMLAWSITQRAALLAQERYADRMHILRIEDVLAQPQRALGGICDSLGLASSQSLRTISWNRNPITEVYPWGTIRTPTVDANRATAGELSDEERVRIREAAGEFLNTFDYVSFLRE